VDWVTLRQGQLLTANLAIYIYTGHPVAPPLFVYSASHDADPALISAIRLASRLFSLEESFIQLKWVLMALPGDYAANSRSMLLDRIPLDIEEDQANQTSAPTTSTPPTPNPSALIYISSNGCSLYRTDTLYPDRMLSLPTGRRTSEVFRQVSVAMQFPSSR
jgi:hypothetical protein